MLGSTTFCTLVGGSAAVGSSVTFSFSCFTFSFVSSTSFLSQAQDFSPSVCSVFVLLLLSFVLSVSVSLSFLVSLVSSVVPVTLSPVSFSFPFDWCFFLCLSFHLFFGFLGFLERAALSKCSLASNADSSLLYEA